MKPMLAAPIAAVPDGSGFVMEPKLDGWRCMVSVEGGEVYLTARSGELIEQLPYIEEAALAEFQDGTLLDGELVGPGLGLAGWGAVQTAVRTSGVHAPRRAADRLRFVAFDVVMAAGVDLRSKPTTARRTELEQLFVGVPGGGVLRLIEQVPASQAQHDAWVAEGHEGSIVKRASARYRPGSRSGGWYKVKHEAEDEATCTGFYAPTRGSKYDGVAVGGITFRTPWGYEGRCAGMDDAERMAMLAAMRGDGPDHWTGRVVEIKHNGRTKDGALRHPNYLRVRDARDKSTPSEGGSMTKTKTKPKTAPARERASKPRVRNYKAMGDDKLIACIADLRLESGDAYDRCMNGGSGDVALDLQVASNAAIERGLV